MRLVALDPLTGKTVWEAKPIRPAGWNCSTPAAVVLANGRERMSVICTAGGTLVRASDGKILCADACVEAPEGAIVPSGDRVYYSYSMSQAVRMIMGGRDHVGVQRLWTHQLYSCDCNYIGLFHADGRAYKVTVTRADPDLALDGIRAAIFDAKTGAYLEELPLSAPDTCGGNVWSLFGISEDNIYTIYGDHMFSSPSGPPMVLSVFPRGPHPAVLARNAVDRTYGAPIIDGDRIYIRGYRGVYGIGYTGKEGRAYEARVIADTLLDAIPANAPPARPRRPVSLKAIRLDGKGARIEDGRGLNTTWLYAGPFAADKADRVLASFGGPEKRVVAGVKASDGSVARTFIELKAGNVQGKDLWPWQVNNNLTLRLKGRRTVDLGRILHGKTPCVAYLYCDLSAEEAATLSLELTTPGTRAWLSGQPVSNGDRVRLAPGRSMCSFLVEIRAEGVPKGGLLFSPRFWHDHDPAARRTRWMDFVKRHHGRLRRVIDLAPGSREAARAKSVLARRP